MSRWGGGVCGPASNISLGRFAASVVCCAFFFVVSLTQPKSMPNTNEVTLSKL